MTARYEVELPRGRGVWGWGQKGSEPRASFIFKSWHSSSSRVWLLSKSTPMLTRASESSILGGFHSPWHNWPMGVWSTQSPLPFPPPCPSLNLVSCGPSHMVVGLPVTSPGPEPSACINHQSGSRGPPWITRHPGTWEIPRVSMFFPPGRTQDPEGRVGYRKCWRRVSEWWWREGRLGRHQWEETAGGQCLQASFARHGLAVLGEGWSGRERGEDAERCPQGTLFPATSSEGPPTLSLGQRPGVTVHATTVLGKPGRLAPTSASPHPLEMKERVCSHFGNHWPPTPVCLQSLPSLNMLESSSPFQERKIFQKQDQRRDVKRILGSKERSFQTTRPDGFRIPKVLTGKAPSFLAGPPVVTELSK